MVALMHPRSLFLAFRQTVRAALIICAATDRGGEMSSSLDVEQLLVDDLQILGAPLTGAKHTNVCVTQHRCGFHQPDFACSHIQQMLFTICAES